MQKIDLYEVSAEELLEENFSKELTLRDDIDHLIINNSKNSSLYMRYPLVLDFINKYKVFYVSELKELLTLEEIPISNRVLSLLLKALVFDDLLKVKFVRSGFFKKRQVYWLKGSEEEASKQIVFFENQLEEGETLCEHGLESLSCVHCILERELGTKLTVKQAFEINHERSEKDFREKIKTQPYTY